MAREYDKPYRSEREFKGGRREGGHRERREQGNGEDRGYDKRRDSSYKPYPSDRENYKDRYREDQRRGDYKDKYRDGQLREDYKDKYRDGQRREDYKDKYRDGQRRGDYKDKYRDKFREEERRGSRDMEAAAQHELPGRQEDQLPYIVMGRNAVREAVRSGRSIDRILVSKEPEGSLREIIGLARDRNIQIREVDRAKLDEMCLPFGHGGKTGNHQGIVAQVPGVEYCEMEDMLALAKERGEQPFIILLDGVEDPHNLGSIIRSAECAGAHGVVIPKRRSASVTAAACKASAGAVEYMKVARVPNIAAAIDKLKESGLWIAGADMEGKPMAEVDLKGAVGLVIGNEGEGLGRLVKEKCDFSVSIPMYGQIGSLNAAVAAAVLMYEKKRQG